MIRKVLFLALLTAFFLLHSHAATAGDLESPRGPEGEAAAMSTKNDDGLVSCYGKLENDPNVCAGHGDCVAENTCICDEGWTGVFCHVPICSPECLNGGICIGPNECGCDGTGYTGDYCQDAECDDCGPHGFCISPNVCLCDEGWAERNCRTPICNPECLNGGICVEPDTCDCTGTFYSGDQCQFPIVQGSDPLEADIALKKTVNDTTPPLGGQVLFTITATNNGPDTGTGIVVQDLLPHGLTYGADGAQGAYVPQSGAWTVGDLAKDSSAVLTMTATVAMSGAITNTAVVSSTETVDDNAENDSASAVMITDTDTDPYASSDDCFVGATQ